MILAKKIFLVLVFGFLLIAPTLFIKYAKPFLTTRPLSEERKKELSAYAVSAVKVYDLGDGLDFANGFTDGLAEIKSYTADLSSLKPFIPLFLERCIHDSLGLVTNEAGNLAAYRLINNTEARYTEKSILPKEKMKNIVVLLKQLNKKISDIIDMTETEDKWSAAGAKRSIEYSINSKIMALCDPTYESATTNLTDAMIDKIANKMSDLAKTISNPLLSDSEIKEKCPIIPPHLGGFNLGAVREITLSTCFDAIYENATTPLPIKKQERKIYLKTRDFSNLLQLRMSVTNQSSQKLNKSNPSAIVYKRERFELKLIDIANSQFGAFTDSFLSATPTPDTNYLRQRELQTKALQLAKEDLIAKHDIKITTDDVIAYAQQFSKTTKEEFKQRQSNMKQQLAAVEAVVESSMTPEKAAETYLKPINLEYEMLDTLKNADKKFLVEMRRTFPESPQDLLMNDLDKYWKAFERENISPFLIPEVTKENTPEYKLAYKKALLEYAKNNLFGKHPDLQNVTAQDIGI